MCSSPALAILVLSAFAGENALNVLRLPKALGDTVRLIERDSVTKQPAVAVDVFPPDDYVPNRPPSGPPGPEGAAFAEHPMDPSDPRDLIHAAAARNGLPEALVQSVAKAESGFDPKAASPRGAIGVMQLMPQTAKALGANPHDPAQNIEAGTRLLRELLQKYHGDVPKALAAYNAGEKAVDRYGGIPPYPETRRYVRKIVRDYLSGGPEFGP